ncbi:uncharacterized protein LOC107370102 isoform X1 [Tetranychus urticae]|uniref:Lipid-binding serum glycoprotein N-terminal domain-containing protein n=1 Tax=Tetranychus urticae TaxID=32264 RepID=T1L407_TETUR|nr:uncharacterized protein LOC107370102 isoform X1 [Tetranychus urticae]
MKNMRLMCSLHNYLIIIITFASLSTIVSNQAISGKLIKDISQRVKKLLDGNLDEKGVLNVNKWFNDNLQDPYYIQTINISESGALTSYKGYFRKMELTGLKSFYIESIELNVGSLDFNVTARIPNLLLTGQYKLKGKIAVLPVSGNGSFWMNFTNVLVTCVTNFNINNGVIKATEVNLDTIPGEINLHFDDLFGGGAASSFSNTILNVLSHSLFDGIKSNTLPNIEKQMKTRINDRLKIINISRFSPTSDSLVDGWIGKVQAMIKERGYDPYFLVNDTKTFSANLIGSQLSGQLFNGTLNGLSTLTRTGPIKAIYVNDSLLLEITMGLERMTSTFDWSLSIGTFLHRSGLLTFNLTNLSTFTRLIQPLQRGAKMELESFSIVDLGHLWLDVDGLGSGDYILEIITNLALNSFKSSIGDIVAQPVHAVMSETLSQQKITFLS